MHLIIVEDLIFDRERLEDLLRAECAAVEEPLALSIYESGEDFLKHYSPGCCDGVFLDILLGSMTGIQVAETLRKKEPNLPIIFTTIEPDFALEGFSVHATDYLVKPLQQENVAWCIAQLRERISRQTSIMLPETAGRGHINMIDLPIDDILYGCYQKHCMEVHALSGIYVTRLSFQEFSERLPKDGPIYVCGRGLAVNLSQVLRVDDGKLLLKNGETLLFSRRRRQAVQNAFADWLFARARKGGWA